MADYIVKRGDTLTKIASNYGNRIAGNNINAKINTLVTVLKKHECENIFLVRG